MHPGKTVITIDMQFGFFHPKYEAVARLEKGLCYPGIKTLLDVARTRDWKVIHAITKHKDESSIPHFLVRKGISPYCLPNEGSDEIITDLCEGIDVLIEKTGYSAFDRTELHQHIINSTEIILCGLAVDCCVLHTALDATSRYDKIVIIPFQCVSASTLFSYMNSLDILGKSAAIIVDLNTFLEYQDDPFHLRLNSKEISDLAESWYSDMKDRLIEISGELDQLKQYGNREFLNRYSSIF